MLVLRLTVAPVMSRPVSVTGTPAMPVSPASRTPLSVLAGVAGLLSANTVPAIDEARSPNRLLAEPVAGRLLIAMALTAALLPLLPGLVPPSP